MYKNLLIIIHKIWSALDRMWSAFYVKSTLLINNIHCEGIVSNGRPFIRRHPKGMVTIGRSLRLNNGKRYNVIGFTQPCVLFVGEGASLIVGDNVGLSQASIICHHRIEIGNNVKIGGGGQNI